MCVCVLIGGIYVFKKLWLCRVCSFPFRVPNCSSRTIEQPSNPLASFKDAGLTRANDYNPNVVTDRTVPILSPELEACRPRPKKPQRTEPKQVTVKDPPQLSVLRFVRTPLLEHRENKKKEVFYFNFFFGRSWLVWPHFFLRQLMALGGSRA